MTSASTTTRPPAVAPDLTLPALIEALTALATLPLLDQAQSARRLAEQAPATLAAHADAGVYTLTRHNTYPEVAAALGLTHSAINKAVQRHRQRNPQA